MKITLIRQRLFLICALTIFVIAKIPELHYAFYWDESWVYAPAIRQMYEHRPSLSPTAISSDYSRGHPLLFHALCAVWMNLWGTSNFSMHCFALFISVLLVIAVYEIMLRLFGERPAILSAILLLFNTAFFFQSSFVVTDVMLALLSLAGIYYYALKRYLPATLVFIMLFFTKESGLVIGLIISADIVISFLRGSPDIRDTMKKLLTLALPALSIMIFFLVQKHALGWYLYPNHTDSIHFTVDRLALLQESMRFIVYYEQKYWLYIIIEIILVGAAISGRSSNALVLALYLPLLFANILVFSHKDLEFFLFIAVTLALALMLPLRLQLQDKQKRFMVLSVWFCIAFIAFTIVNFHENRYLIPVMVFVSVIFLAVAYDYYVPRQMRWSTLIICIVILSGINNFRIPGKEALVYERMDVQQHLVDYFEKNIGYNEKIASLSFLEQVHLNDPKTGFLHSNSYYTHTSDHINDEARYVIIDTIDTNPDSYGVRSDSLFRRIYRYQLRGSWVEVYERKQP